MWHFGKDRRRHKRYPVDIPGLLEIEFDGVGLSMPVRVSEISLGGARLQLASLRTGSGHLIADHPRVLVLKLTLPPGMLLLPVTVRWFRHLPEQGFFLLGIQFENPSPEDLELLQQVLRRRCFAR